MKAHAKSERTRQYRSAVGQPPSKGARLSTSEVAKLMGLSPQRIRQLEASAFRKLRAAFPGLEELLK
jgi:DNA-directed RNA polymerase sigma subunit (sigma70/sigma32)